MKNLFKFIATLFVCVAIPACGDGDSVNKETSANGYAGASPVKAVDPGECSKQPWNCPAKGYRWLDCYSEPTDQLCQAPENADKAGGWVVHELQVFPEGDGAGQYHSDHCANGVRVTIGVDGALAGCI